jgi:hypothetical protein
LRGVVHLWALDAAPPEQTTLASLREAMALGSVSVLHLVQELVRRAGAEAPPGLWLGTRGAQRVGDEADPVAVAQAPLWGLGKVVTLEHPRLRCTCVDLDPDAAPDAALLVRELRAADRETQVAYRGGKRHALRLTRPEATAAVRVPSLVSAR